MGGQSLARAREWTKSVRLIDRCAGNARAPGRCIDKEARLMEASIVGAGIGGLTLALTLQRAGIPARVFDAAPEMAPIGAGINVLPHASKELCTLGLEGELSRVAVETREAV